MVDFRSSVGIRGGYALVLRYLRTGSKHAYVRFDLVLGHTVQSSMTFRDMTPDQIRAFSSDLSRLADEIEGV